MIYAEKFGGAALTPEFAEWLMGYQEKFTELIPTPRASDYRGAALSRTYQRQRERERERKYRGQLMELVELCPLGRLGYLSPMWVEWLMGFPIGWTELNVSGMQ